MSATSSGFARGKLAVERDRLDTREPFGALGRREKEPAPDEVEPPAQIVVLDLRLDRNGSGAGRDDRPVGDDPLGAVRRDDGDAFLRAYAARRERARQRLRAFDEGRECDLFGMIALKRHDSRGSAALAEPAQQVLQSVVVGQAALASRSYFRPAPLRRNGS
jgi:hypothetical protein